MYYILLPQLIAVIVLVEAVTVQEAIFAEPNKATDPPVAFTEESVHKTQANAELAK